MTMCAIYVQLSIVVYWIFTICVTTSTSEAVFRLSRTEATWNEARENCGEFGGHLATLPNLDSFRAKVRSDGNDQLKLDPNTALWVGGSLDVGAWTWTDGQQYGVDKAYDNTGCYRYTARPRGTRLLNMTPETCLETCGWQGTIGIKYDMCLCEDNLGELSFIPDGVCHIKCEGQNSMMCGGIMGVSTYRAAKRTLIWADTENKSDYNCALLRKNGADSKIQLMASTCNMQTRYLCLFEDDYKCGLQRSCLKWSTQQATWNAAYRKCSKMNGSLAADDRLDVDYSRDLGRLPPGIFWLGLRRSPRWKWTDGVPISMSDFSRSTARMTGGPACTVLRSLAGHMELEPRPCGNKMPYLCQYDFKTKRADPASGVSNSGSDFNTQPSTPVGYPTRAGSHKNGSYNHGNRVSSYDMATVAGPEAEPRREFGDRLWLNECFLIIIGFVSGMVCVLIIGLGVYLVCKCIPGKPQTHLPLASPRRQAESSSVSYSSKDGSIHIVGNSPPSDVTYDSVYDSESPFRRTQRLIRMGSAHSYRHAPSRRPKSDVSDSSISDYTWRGMIGGKIEVLNTELREPESKQSRMEHANEFEFDLHRLDAESSDKTTNAYANDNRQHIRQEITTDLDALEESEGIYDLPNVEKVQSREDVHEHTGHGHVQRIPIIPDIEKIPGSNERFPRFLRIENTIDEQSQKENIYASIKKPSRKGAEKEEKKDDDDDARKEDVCSGKR